MATPGTYSGAGKTGLGSFGLLDDDVASNVAKAADTSSPLIQQARQAGVEQANSRGLLNSSIAGGASEAEAYKVALPIGQQNAQQSFQKNLSNQQFEQTNETQAEGNQSQERIAAGNQQTQRDIAAGNNAADLERTRINIASNENIANLDASSKAALQSMQIDSNERIANLNVKANQQDKAQSAALTAANIYASMANAIANNPNIPADARNALMENAKSMLNANFGLVEQLYNIDLNWDTAPFAGSGSAPTAPVTPNQQTGQADYSGNYGGDGGSGLGYSGGGGSGDPGAWESDMVSWTDPGGNQYNAAGRYLGTV